jgi:YD repeat-containing protein
MSPEGGTESDMNHAETQVFTYHPSGQIATATALDADVIRTYHPSGILLIDTLKVRDSLRTATPHVYSLSYTYDRNGRRLSRTLGPSSLFAGSPMAYSYNGWGALASVTDISGKTYSFTYNAIGELQTTNYPASIARTLGYDGAGRLSSDVITNSQSVQSAFPFDLGGSVRNFAVTNRNARGQIISATDPALIGGPIPALAYDSAGFLVSSRRSQSGYVLAIGGAATFIANDTMSYDGLGNILRRSGAWSLGTRLGSYVTTQTFNAQGRLATQLDARNGTAGASNRVTEYQYDASGNTRFEATKAASADPTTVQERASFYGADDRLIGVDLRSPGRRMLEEYRYDALGRRVWASRDQMCAPTSDLSCVTDGPTRTVWDGTDEVAEIRAPLGATNGAELNGGFPLLPHAGVGDPNPFYGRVVYGPSLTIDEPVSVTRYEYRDNPSGGTSAMWPTFTLMPFWDYRRTPVYGVTTDGATAIPLNPGGTSCPNPGVATSTRCALVSWNFAWDAYRQETGGYLTLSWHGNVNRPGFTGDSVN